MGKLPYVAPNLRVVSLAAKEVLAIGCKNAAEVAAGGIFPPCWASSCHADGT